ncbi:penicillin-binding protein 2 [bacterium]|nr:penicillin-binding protein 2 [bacterium]
MKKSNLFVLLLVLSGIFLLILLKLFGIILNSSQSFSKRTLTVEGKRGDVLDSRGKLIATSLLSYDIYFYGKGLKKDEFNSLLSETVNFLKENRQYEKGMKQKITNAYNNRRSILLVKGILSLELYEKFMSELEKKYKKIRDIKGKFYYNKKYTRYYPFRDLYGQVVGFVNKEHHAICGIERGENGTLRGTAGKYIDNHLHLRGGTWGRTKWLNEPENGQDIKLTLNTVLQDFCYEALKKGVEKFRAKRGTVVLMETSTGKIRAWTGYPSFNPNIYSKYGYERFKNMSLEDIFEPGSILKPIIIGFLLSSKYHDNSVLSPHDVFYCENGKYLLKKGNKKRIIRDVEKNRYLNVKKVLVHSSNIGMAKIMQKYYKKGNLKDLYVFLLGILNLKRSIGVPLPNYTNGRILNYKKWNEIFSLASIGMGYEISAPLINFLLAFNTIPSKGKLLKPQILAGKKVQYFNDNVFPKKTISFLQTALRDVVIEGTGKKVNSKYIAIAGKTGTAKKYDPQTKKYSTDKYLASFIGYFPADDPKYTMGVFIDEPGKKYYGGEVAGSIFKEIAERIYFYELNKKLIKVAVKDE